MKAFLTVVLIIFLIGFAPMLIIPCLAALRGVMR